MIEIYSFIAGMSIASITIFAILGNIYVYKRQKEILKY